MPDKILLPVETTISDTQIVSKINSCIAILGGDAELLSIIGSFKATLPNNEILRGLECWIDETLKQKEVELKELWEYSNR